MTTLGGGYGDAIALGVYLFHGFFVSIFGVALLDSKWAGNAASGTFFLALLFLVGLAAYGWAYMVHRLVELPGIRVGRYLNTQSPVARIAT
jgi:peptidoglycan/LPS O-acetylase OafA/YrhL